jgi:hypothetical protein
MENTAARELQQCYQKLESKKTLLLRLDEAIPWKSAALGSNKSMTSRLKVRQSVSQ